VQKPGELTAQERAALTLWLLLQVPMSTAEVAARCGLTEQGARFMLNNMSRVVPLHLEDGKWHVRKP